MKAINKIKILLKRYVIFFIFEIIFIYILFKDKNYSFDLIFKSTLCGITAFVLPMVIYSFVLHRHDKIKSNIQLVVYDCIYALVLKYVIMIFIFIYVFKFSEINYLIFIIVFVFSIVYSQILKIRFFIRKDNQ